MEQQTTDEVQSIGDTVTQEEVVGEILQKLEQSRQERIPFELQWQLNTNFLLGNQYCDINPYTQEIIELEKPLWFLEREVFNHIAPIIETRKAKLARVQPTMTVRPATNDFNDISTAKVSSSVLKSAQSKLKSMDKIQEATSWSELTGTSFYKSGWDHGAGKVLGVVNGAPIAEGDLSQYVASPYEIFPETPFANLDGQKWFIHEKAYNAEDAEDIWGVRIGGKDVEVYSLGQSAEGAGGLGYNVTVPYVLPSTKKDQVLVREYYERPSKRYPEGRLIIIADTKLVFYGSLPYKIGEDGKRDFPIDRQVSIDVPGCFWGQSIIERLIPLQRRYNAVKNRKQEYLNRVTLGVVDVERGAYDYDFEEGLAPGTVLERNPTSQPAQSLNFGNTDLSEFAQEEDKLQNEFIMISGVSELARNSQVPTGAGSGVALDILREQDDTRLSLTAEHIRKAVLSQAKKWIRLYKQFVVGPRMDRLVGEDGEVLVAEWNKNDLTSDDIVFNTENELSQTPAQRKQQVFDMLGAGLFNDPDTGQLNKRALAKIFEMLQLGNWEAGLGIDDLHRKRAQKENLYIQKGMEPEIREYDDDNTHIEEHIRFMLSGEYEELLMQDPQMAQTMDMHVKLHERSMMFKAQRSTAQQMMIQPQQPVQQAQ